MKKIMSLFAFMSVLGLGLMLTGLYMVNVGQFVLIPMEDFSIFELPTVLGKAYKEPTLTYPTTLQDGKLPKEILIPTTVEFYVNQIPVPATMLTSFFPIKKTDINTYSGKFGPYDFDPREFIGVELCTFPRNFPDMLSCEKVPVNYANNYLHFARGYPEDEYIADQAFKNFGAVYFVVNPLYGNIAQSNTAILRLIEHD